MDRRFGALESRIDGLDGKMSWQFRWVVGIQVLFFVTLVGALASAFFAIR